VNRNHDLFETLPDSSVILTDLTPYPTTSVDPPCAGIAQVR